MAVYFIRAGESGPVKIGKSVNISERIAEFQIAHYEELTIIRTIDCADSFERLLHRYFRQHHIRGEWFHFSDEMLSVDPKEIKPGGLWHYSRCGTIGAQVVDAFGGLTKMAELTGWPISTIQYWPRSGKIPGWRRNAIIEAAKRHKVKLPPEYTSKAA